MGFGVSGLEVGFTVSGFERLKLLRFSSLGFGGLAVQRLGFEAIIVGRPPRFPPSQPYQG